MLGCFTEADRASRDKRMLRMADRLGASSAYCAHPQGGQDASAVSICYVSTPCEDTDFNPKCVKVHVFKCSSDNCTYLEVRECTKF